MRAPLLVLVVLPPVLLAAACSGSSSLSAASPTAPITVAKTATATATAAATGTTTTTATATVTTTRSVSQVTSPASSAPTCRTSQLALRLGNGGAAAGTAYQPIVFANHGSTCALRGYPGVAFVAPATGRQVGSAAWHNPQHPVMTLLIAPGSSASALLGIVNYQNFPPGECLSHPVSGLRIYPPGNTAAAYVPLKTASTACSTPVGQLGVAAVVPGSTGQ